jgi:hypothetical protein
MNLLKVPIWRNYLPKNSAAFQKLSVNGRLFSTNNQITRRKNLNENPYSHLITMDDAMKWKDMTKGQKVVFATRQTSYAGIIAVGVGLTAVLSYLVVTELFGKDSPQNVYSKTLSVVQANERARNLLGDPIAGYRANNRHGSTRHLNEYVDSKDGVKKAFMSYDVSGPNNSGTCNVWLKKNEKGNWEEFHINVEIPGRGIPGTRVVVLDTI